MEKVTFSLDIRENNRFTRIVQIIFGAACTCIAVFWLAFNIKAQGTGGALWVTIIFLSGFGVYQIYAGLGYSSRFIEIAPEKIRLKKYNIGRVKEILPDGIEKIESLPLSINFHLKPSGMIRLRFGTTYPEKIDIIMDSLEKFAELNNIKFEETMEII
jgi:hypothetical protein